jgi:type I site-specific restriction endonuclease
MTTESERQARTRRIDLQLKAAGWNTAPFMTEAVT